MNIGVIEGGSAPNVVAEKASAELLFRTGENVRSLLESIRKRAKGLVQMEVPYRSDPIFFRVPRGAGGEIVSFACDLPLLTSWGEPLLIGPGSIRDAHTAEESVSLSEVESAVGIYRELAAKLLRQGEASLEPPERRLSKRHFRRRPGSHPPGRSRRKVK